MEAREAIFRAKAMFEELFTEETISEIGLEEVEFDAGNNVWRITIGFARARYPLNRWYKVVSFDDAGGKLISIKNRESELT